VFEVKKEIPAKPILKRRTYEASIVDKRSVSSLGSALGSVWLAGPVRLGRQEQYAVLDQHWWFPAGNPGRRHQANLHL
jgi:hypothetical protein